jgi:mono/diheme cytochrome c family protein
VSLLAAAPCRAAEKDLTISIGGVTRSFSAEALLKNPAATTIDIPKDASYSKPMHYQALPLVAALKDFALPGDQVLQAVATDGFTATLPTDLIRRDTARKGAVPYLAIEPPGQPWPKLAGKDTSAGPFYIVWLRPEKDDVRPEQWPYGVVKIAAADSPAKRWPALALDKKLAADAPARAGQALFATNCMVCHRMNGAGDAEVGPDLNLPKNPVEYFKKDALHAYIRDPSSLRAWKAMGMKGFGNDALSDREIDLIIAYLDYMAAHKAPAK